MKSFNSLFALVAAVAATFAVPAIAHHSGAGFATNTIEISGVVKEFQFKNPHSWIQVNVTDATGKMVEWSIEWGSPNQLGREGYRPSTFPAGAKVSFKIHPMSNGNPAGGFVAAKFADGKIIGKWDGD